MGKHYILVKLRKSIGHSSEEGRKMRVASEGNEFKMRILARNKYLLWYCRIFEKLFLATIYSIHHSNLISDFRFQIFLGGRGGEDF